MGVSIPHASVSVRATARGRRYYELFNASGIPLVIENCHQGQNITDGGNPGQMGKDWCPYNLFRTSGDIVNLWDRVMSNLMTTVPFLSPDDKWGGGDVTRPVSRPGCWAYPDMVRSICSTSPCPCPLVHALAHAHVHAYTRAARTRGACASVRSCALARASHWLRSCKPHCAHPPLPLPPPFCCTSRSCTAARSWSHARAQRSRIPITHGGMGDDLGATDPRL